MNIDYKHQNSISCPTCGRVGILEWAETPMGQKDYVRIEGNFHERMAAKPPYPIELVCGTCGTAQAGPLQL